MTFPHNHCHGVSDTLVKFRKDLVPQTLLKRIHPLRYLIAIKEVMLFLHTRVGTIKWQNIITPSTLFQVGVVSLPIHASTQPDSMFDLLHQFPRTHIFLLSNITSVYVLC